MNSSDDEADTAQFNMQPAFGLLLTTVMAKQCRGRFISVGRVLRDMKNIKDAALDDQLEQETNMSSTDMLKAILGNTPAKSERTKVEKDMYHLTNRVKQLESIDIKEILSELGDIKSALK